MAHMPDISAPAPFSRTAFRDRLISIVDRDLTTCETLSLLFRLEGYQTNFFTDTAGFYAGANRQAPNAAVLNANVSEPYDGLEALRRIKSSHFGLGVVIIEDRADVSVTVEAMREGATDVLLKPIDSERLLASVSKALGSRLDLEGALGRRAVGTTAGFDRLTARETQVLQGVVNGKTNKEIALLLDISYRTVEVHRASAMLKLGVHNAASLIRLVLTS